MDHRLSTKKELLDTAYQEWLDDIRRCVCDASTSNCQQYVPRKPSCDAETSY